MKKLNFCILGILLLSGCSHPTKQELAQNMNDCGRSKTITNHLYFQNPNYSALDAALQCGDQATRLARRQSARPERQEVYNASNRREIVASSEATAIRLKTAPDFLPDFVAQKYENCLKGFIDTYTRITGEEGPFEQGFVVCDTVANSYLNSSPTEAPLRYGEFRAENPYLPFNTTRTNILHEYGRRIIHDYLQYKNQLPRATYTWNNPTPAKFKTKNKNSRKAK